MSKTERPSESDEAHEPDNAEEKNTSFTSAYKKMSNVLGHTSIEELENKLNEAETKLNEASSTIEDYKNQILRIRAESDNVRKRAEKDVASAHKYGLERLITELLPILDSLERGLSIEISDNEFAKRIYEGLEMTLNLLLSTLAKFGVKAVDPIKEPFNPELHQAISLQEDPNAPSDSVLQVLQKGYLLNDRLIRPALVVVAKNK